jgi:hypothetical protein
MSSDIREISEAVTMGRLVGGDGIEPPTSCV